MRFTRSARTWWSRSLIASLLFLQLASAAYACAMHSTKSADASMAGMPCAQAMAGDDSSTMDPDQPGLCHEHCKGGSPTIEPAATAVPGAPALVALFAITTPVALPVEARAWLGWRVERDSGPPQPHAILHCCFRI
ncbi:hypothetical protein [Methylibium sp.]|uniref:hypothetical protein n=1 Tax=Methylibium sp. TaxID=2067992 RepID=UPI003F73038B